jgi:hypothetical protein
MQKVVIAVAAGLALAASSMTGAMAAHLGGGGHGGGGGHFSGGGHGMRANVAGGGVGAVTPGVSGPNVAANNVRGNHMGGGEGRSYAYRGGRGYGGGYYGGYDGLYAYDSPYCYNNYAGAPYFQEYNGCYQSNWGPGWGYSGW